MSKISRCKRCKGVKVIMGMGGLQQNCKVCKGTGFHKDIDDTDEKSLLESDKEHEILTPKENKPKKRRPRLPNVNPAEVLHV